MALAAESMTLGPGKLVHRLPLGFDAGAKAVRRAAVARSRFQFRARGYACGGTVVIGTALIELHTYATWTARAGRPGGRYSARHRTFRAEVGALRCIAPFSNAAAIHRAVQTRHDRQRRVADGIRRTVRAIEACAVGPAGAHIATVLIASERAGQFTRDGRTLCAKAVFAIVGGSA